MAADPIEERIIALETRIAYQDRLLDTLDEVVREFTARIETLERKLQLVQGAVADTIEPGPSDDPPPHY
jgi:SlyX protein